MKIDNLYESLLTEGISPIVYHSTQLPMLSKIIDSNELYMAPVFAKSAEADMPTPKMYFLSTARTRTGKYHQGRYNSALIKLDGRGLSFNLKGAAVDYWGADYRGYGNGGYEEEDRIYSNKNSIKNISKFILGIDLVVNEIDPRLIRKIALYCKKIGADFRVFKTPNDVVAQQNIVNPSVYMLTDFNKQEIPYQRIRTRPEPDGYKDGFIGLFYALKMTPENRSTLPAGAEKQLYEFLMKLRYRDINGISSDMTMAQNNEGYRSMMFEISKMLKNIGYTNWADAVPYLRSKWGLK